MEKFNFQYLNNLKNHGQNAEQSIRFALAGKVEKPDNVRYDKGTDCLDFQIKSSRATVCKGLNIAEHIAHEKASRFIYATNDGIAYIMDGAEYLVFCELFATATRESKANGGAEKMRLKAENKAMIEWLTARA